MVRCPDRREPWYFRELECRADKEGIKEGGPLELQLRESDGARRIAGPSPRTVLGSAACKASDPLTAPARLEPIFIYKPSGSDSWHGIIWFAGTIFLDTRFARAAMMGDYSPT